MPKRDELYIAAQEHLTDLYSGKVGRDAAQAEVMAQRQKVMLREARAKRKAVKARMFEVIKERDGIQVYMDEMLEGVEHWKGGIDECDHAIEGCNNEIGELKEQLGHLNLLLEDD